MPRLRWLLLPLALAAGACAGPGGKDSTVPAYVPANATPPTVSAASNQLVGPTWHWASTTGADGKVAPVAAPDRYTLSFQGGGRVQLKADCNRGGGGYDINGTAMTMGPAAMTRVACPPDSQEGAFLSQLSRVTNYTVTGNELVLTLGDGRTMRLRPQP